MPDRIRVLIVDDHPIVRSGLRAALDTDPSLTVVDDVPSGEAALQAARQGQLDVVLMDLNLGAGLDGADTTRQLARLPSSPSVLVLTAYESEADILRAIEAGAIGYLLKDTEPAELIAAIHVAAAGETVLAPSVATRLISRVREPGRVLTRRETQVLQMVAEGATNASIGKTLFITEATVKSHLVQVFAKLSVDNRTGAVAEGRWRALIR